MATLSVPLIQIYDIMTFTPDDYKYMRRALELAALGRGHVSPNPMVGAVIVAPDSRIIGEGWHRHYGGPHAEVNAVNSVADSDRHLLPESTIYVTLEPCSHYGKTPPCAKLLCDIHIGREVVAADDPNPRVAGRGISMLREAGIEVATGLLAHESCLLNKTFMTAHTLHRPFVTLKWAQSADGYLDHKRCGGESAAQFSTPLSSLTVHSRRAVHDAIAVGARTFELDSPRLNTRLVAGSSPKRIVFDRSNKISDLTCIHITSDRPLEETLSCLYREDNITSLMVEGGASLLNSFIQAGLWDEAYIEVAAPLGDKGAVKAPVLQMLPAETYQIDGNTIYKYTKNHTKFA